MENQPCCACLTAFQILIEGAQREGQHLVRRQDIFAREVDVTRLRRTISMVFAIPTPLPGTIYENMTYGLEMAGMKDRAELDERVERGLRQAALWDEVKDRLRFVGFCPLRRPETTPMPGAQPGLGTGSCSSR